MPGAELHRSAVRKGGVMSTAGAGAAPLIVLEARCKLGEGLLLHDGEVSWVDISTNTIFHFDGVRVVAVQLPVKATVLLERRGSELVLASDAGLGVFNLATYTYRPGPDFSMLFQSDTHRTNDGCALNGGGYLVGTMHRHAPEVHTGSVFYVDPSGAASRIASDIHIPNTFIQLSDGSVLISDSQLGLVYRYSLSGVPKRIQRAAVWYQAEEGVAPDGGCLLPGGSVAIAMWDASCVRIFDEQGSFLRVLRVGTKRPTNCKYSAGSRLLWVTSASEGLGNTDSSCVPAPGQTFAIRL